MSQEFTPLLQAADIGDSHAAESLLPLVDEELRKLAAHKMAQQPPGHTLNAMALMHEAWLRFNENAEGGWRNGRHFFAAAVEAMRDILVDRARGTAAF